MECECDEKGVLNPVMTSMYDNETELPFVDHKPNECKCKNDLKQYLRHKKKVWLCSNCSLSTDKQI